MLFSFSRGKGTKPRCSALLWEEASGLAPGAVVLGLKCKHLGRSLRGHEMWVRSVHEVESMAHLTEGAAQGDLVLRRRFWLWPSSHTWMLKYTEGTAVESREGKRERSE